MNEFIEISRLLLGSIALRPYVYLFLVCYFVFSVYQWGWRRSLYFLVTTYLLAFACEYSSTRNGFPFGPYSYLDATRNQELWISNVPFFDSLSFVFLSYFSWVLASWIVWARSSKLATFEDAMLSRLTPYIGGLLMMLLDVVIDPVALLGHKWFLGQIYLYPYEGFYFGVTAANFAGWFFVGFITQKLAALAFRISKRQRKDLSPHFLWGCFGVYAGVFTFNLGITFWIEAYRLTLASTLVTVITLGGVVGALGFVRIKMQRPHGLAS